MKQESTDLRNLVKRDLDFVVHVSNKYNMIPPSWYWRLQDETEEQWIDRRVSLSEKRQYFEGLLCGTKMSLSYKIPLPLKPQTTVTLNMQTTSFDALYDKLEKLAQEI